MHLSKKQQIIGISCLILSLTFTALSAGINVITYPAILIANSVPVLLIGFAFSFELIAGIATSFFLSRMISKIGLKNSIIIFTLIYIAIILGIYFYINYAFWLFLSALNGICWISFFAIRQAWINNLISSKQRSVMIGLSGAVVSTGFLVAPMIVDHFGARNYQLFLISAIFVAISSLMLIPTRKTSPSKIIAARIAFKSFFKSIPQAFLGNFVAELQIFSVLVFSIILGQKIGYSTEKSGFLISAFAASGICDLCSGILIKKLDNPKQMINIGILLCLLSAISAMIWHQNYLLLLAIYFIYGVSIGLTFVAASTVTNNYYQKEQLIAANTTFQAIGTIGALIGSLLIGFFMQIFDFYGFFIAIILVNFTVLIYNRFYVKEITN